MSNASRGRGGKLLGAYLGLFFLYLESPLLIIVITSFSESVSVRFPPSGFSTTWYIQLWDHLRGMGGTKAGLATSLWTSFWLSAVAMVGAVVAGGLVALGLRRFVFPGHDLVRQCFLLPILFPQVVIGVGLLLWFSAIRGVPSWLRLLLGYLILAMPYVVVTTSASLETLDEQLEEAAMNLGANRMQTVWHITLPLIQSGIVSGALFAWLATFSNFTVSFFLYSGEARPLPVWVYEVLQFVIDPTIAALSTCLILLTLVALVALNRLFSIGRLVGLRR